MEWIKTSEIRPEHDGSSYSSVRCVVWRRGSFEVLCFNHEHECWDDETGDDYECDIEDVEYWMIPNSPI